VTEPPGAARRGTTAAAPWSLAWARGACGVVLFDGAGRPREAVLRPQGPGRLAAEFRLDASGSHHPVVKLGGAVLKGAPVTLPYAPEYEPQPADQGRALLAQLGRLTGGTERLSVDGAFTRAPGAPGRLALTPHLVALVLALMLVEVALRRFFFRWERPRAAARPTAPAATGQEATGPEPALAASTSQGPGSAVAAPPTGPEPAPDVTDALAAARARARSRLE